MAYPFSISLGVEWNLWTGRKSRRAVAYRQNRHITIFGPTRSGKGVCLEIPNLLRLKGLSIISIDPKGQNAAVTARWRRKVSRVVMLNPLDVLGLGSAGFNPLAALDPAAPRFFEEAANIAEALIKIDASGDLLVAKRPHPHSGAADLGSEACAKAGRGDRRWKTCARWLLDGQGHGGVGRFSACQPGGPLHPGQ